MAEKKSSRLGTGLSALFGDEPAEEGPGAISTLPISKVEPRRDYISEYADFNRQDNFELPEGQVNPMRKPAGERV